MSETVLAIKDLTVNYGHVNALDHVSLFVESGKVVCVIGANGAGKSSLLNTISGLVKPAGGSIEYYGENLILLPHKIVKKGVAQVPEGRRIFGELTVEENLIMGCVNGMKDFNRIRDKVFDLFPRLKERRSQNAGTMSGGEQQMLAIARAMMSQPKLIMFDEPSMGLAPVVVKQVFKFIQEINESGTTVLLIEQNAKKALSSSDYCYVLENGRIRMEGDSKAMLENKDVQKAYLGE